MPKIVDRDKKRKHIIEDAMPIFARHGIGGVTIAEVAAAADMGKGTIYEYFSSKEEIVTAAFDRYMGSYMQDMAPLLESPMDPVLKLRSFIVQTVSWVLRDQMMLGVLSEYFAIIRRVPEAFDISHVEDVYRNIQTITRRLFAKAKETGGIRTLPDDAAVMSLMAAVDGIILHAATFDDYDHESVTNALMDAFFALHS